MILNLLLRLNYQLIHYLDVTMYYGRRLCVHVSNGACHLIEDAQDDGRIER